MWKKWRKKLESDDDNVNLCDEGSSKDETIPIRLYVQEIHTNSIPKEEYVDVFYFATQKLVSSGFTVLPGTGDLSAPLVRVTYEEKPVEIDIEVTQLGIGKSGLRHGIDIYYDVEVLSPDEQQTLFQTSSKVPAFEKGGIIRSWSTGDPMIILYHDATDRFLYSSLFKCLGDLALIGLGRKTYIEFLDDVFSSAEEGLPNQFLREALSALDEYPFEMAKSAVSICIKCAETVGMIDPPIAEFLVRTAARDYAAVEAAIQTADEQFRDDLYKMLDEAKDLVIDTPMDESEDIRVIGRWVRKLNHVSHQEQRLEIYNSIAKVGKLGAEELIKLLPNIRFDYRRMEIVETLVEMGPVAVESLVNALADQSEYIREGASKALHTIGKPAIESLKNALHTKDVCTQKLAAEILEEIGNTS